MAITLLGVDFDLEDPYDRGEEIPPPQLAPTTRGSLRWTIIRKRNASKRTHPEAPRRLISFTHLFPRHQKIVWLRTSSVWTSTALRQAKMSDQRSRQTSSEGSATESNIDDRIQFNAPR